MDAISFVFGVASHHLRGKQLKDLVYRYEAGAEPKKLHCLVKVFLIAKNNKTQKVFARSIDVSRGTLLPSLCGCLLTFLLIDFPSFYVYVC